MSKEQIDTSPETVLKSLWQCRDFELKLLWQRASFLAVFLTLTIAGYGTLWQNALSTEKYTMPAFNIAGVVISLFGIILSWLWIFMIRGSKAWYEVYEQAISAFVTKDQPGFNKEGTISGVSISLRGFKLEEINQLDLSVISQKRFFTLSAGTYSPSRILILLGYLSVVFFSTGLVSHTLLIFQWKVVALISVVVISLVTLFLAIVKGESCIKSKRLEVLISNTSKVDEKKQSSSQFTSKTEDAKLTERVPPLDSSSHCS